MSHEAYHKLVQKRLTSQSNSIRQQAERIEREFSELKSETIRQADMALQGMLVLPGTGGKPYFVGNPPRWLENPVNDNEFVWGLNRMHHWIPLLRAFSLTGEGYYAQKVVDEFRDWRESCPRLSMASPGEFHGVHPWRALEVGIRMFDSWTAVIPHLLGTEFLSPDFLAEFAASVFEHGEVLFHISPQLWPEAAHNHYLMENLGLLSLSCLFPEFSTAETWKRHAVSQLERCAAVQITAEGGQVEGCPHYHSGCVGWLVLALSAARSNGIEFSPEYISKIEKGIDYSMHALRPSGTAVPWGDSDAEEAGPIHSALSGWHLFHNPDYLRIVVNCCGTPAVRACCIEGAWDGFGSAEMLAAIDHAESAEISLPVDSWQKSLNQAMLRTDWSHDALSLFFACRTPFNNTHAHIDPMSFDFTAYGRPLIVDPGRFTYREDADRRDFKCAAWHNTLVINRRDPFEYISSWAYGAQKPGYILDVRQQPGCKAVIARHDNYEPAIHFRAVAILENAFLLVVDWIENLSPGDLLQIYYHIDSIRVDMDRITGRAQTRDEAVANMLIVPSADLTGELLPGRISDIIDVARPSTRLCLTASRSGETTRAFATVVVPWPVSSSLPMVSAPSVLWKPDGLRCEFQVNGKALTFELPELRALKSS